MGATQRRMMPVYYFRGVAPGGFDVGSLPPSKTPPAWPLSLVVNTKGERGSVEAFLFTQINSELGKHRVTP